MKIKIGIGVLVVLVVVLFITIISKNNNAIDTVTAIVQRGDITNTVSVSGFIEAKKTAKLSFPVVGTVTDVFVEEGDTVKKGDLLATLGSRRLVALRADALASLQKAQASYSELLEGPTEEARLVTETNVLSAQEALDEITKTENEKVANALRALLSSDLRAYAQDPNESATAPTVSGTYTCTQEGTYNLTVYNSGTPSGYSYQLTGLEENTYPVTTSQPSPLGTCGLLIQFTDGDAYSYSNWTIPIPNTKSTSYTTYKNAYDLAVTQRNQRITAAKNALLLAQKIQEKEVSAPRSTRIQQSSASIKSAQARIAQIDAQIADLSIVAPFDSMVTSLDIQPGETGTTKPVITLLAQDAFELKARIPEIDIKKIKEGQKAVVSFDADPNTPLTGAVTFVSPLATIIDGVAYFETTVLLEETPTWIRSGLNADIDITVDSYTDVMFIPKRYLIIKDNASYILLQSQSKEPIQTSIEIISTTNDGNVAITGVSEGDVVIAP